MKRLDNVDIVSAAIASDFYVVAATKTVTVPAGVTMLEVVPTNTVYIRTGGTTFPVTWPPAADTEGAEPWYALSAVRRFAVSPGEVLKLHLPASALAQLFWY